MAEFLERLKSSARRPTTCTVSISSSQAQTFSDQTTKFDKESGTPIIAPLDTVTEVCLPHL